MNAQIQKTHAVAVTKHAPPLPAGSPAEGEGQDLQEQLVATGHQLVLLEVCGGPVHHAAVVGQQGLRGERTPQSKRCCSAQTSRLSGAYLEMVVAILQVRAEGGQQLDGEGSDVLGASLLQV